MNQNASLDRAQMADDLQPPGIHDILRAQAGMAKAKELFGGYTKLIQNPPLLRELSGGVEIVLALENRQPTHSYKIRGAFTKLMSLPPEASHKGVITASTGNHGRAVAYMAKKLGIPCEIVVPDDTPNAKTSAIVSCGGTVIQYGSTYDDAYFYAKQLAEKHEAFFVDGSGRLAVAGQGTLALEVLEQVPNVDAILVPVGGGALLAGVAIAAKEFAKMRGRAILVIGAEPEGAACCYESFKADKLVTVDNCDTIADGLRIQTPDAHLFPILRDLVDEIVKVPETGIEWGMGLLAGICGNLVEGAAVLGPMALLSSRGVLYGAKGMEIDLRGKTVVTPLTGGNVDLSTIEMLIWRSTHQKEIGVIEKIG